MRTHKSEASPVLALMVQMRLRERMGGVHGGSETEGERVGLLEAWAEGV